LLQFFFNLGLFFFPLELHVDLSLLESLHLINFNLQLQCFYILVLGSAAFMRIHTLKNHYTQPLNNAKPRSIKTSFCPKEACGPTHVLFCHTSIFDEKSDFRKLLHTRLFRHDLFFAILDAGI
jgi:hypothetical protein